MAATARHEKDMQEKAKRALMTATDPLDKLRQQCLARGATGISSLGRTFRLFDDDGSKRLDINEFRKGMHDYGVQLKPTEVEELFNLVDSDNSGSINYEEFLMVVRPPMSKARVDIIKRAFSKLDKTGDHVITMSDLKGVYSVKQHPKYQNGEMTEEQILTEFLNVFEKDEKTRDGIVTGEEFMNYYAGVSSSIDTDCYFDLMMRNSWKL
ncbi:PREDICTED: calcyphosin-like protein [Priapulus caudatus]|uniref:Calcyphosin-like protein n=1 Tax=Priapulus caudatus TaxID=37621 RepID=A0ABM1E7B1_PRICU|nr:PREDICTED: calcyphosin-like protein [Priapulus caudatus]XP_014668081.1 PREDICTED: calcyphosin-like protein [Priapulus caudatus]XP_014668082.1 PREDICTED: calcyphosin-like protein [Priapulus caudatus]XP_014668083.1 PREDICTED: calcyphosin-like protein [Priapulus caudatus]XP_014668084.1 PREDICTED: calcyphosin-like protein [Priapulus caudatus]